jgi:hypothetical protein
MKPSYRPDFLAEVRFLAPEEGGRRGPVVQGYRADIRYADDPKQQAWIVWPRFLCPNGSELLDKAIVPPRCDANFYIINDDMRRQVHLARLRPGVRFEIVEGAHIVASCVVKRLLFLDANAA